MKTMTVRICDQKEAELCLATLLDIDSGLTESEVDWIDKFSKVVGQRPFSRKERTIITEIYDRRCI